MAKKGKHEKEESSREGASAKKKKEKKGKSSSKDQERGKRNKESKQKRPSTIKGAFLMFLTLLILLAAAAALTYYDIAGLKVRLATVLKLNEAVASDREQTLLDWEARLQREAQEIKVQSTDMDTRETILNSRETTLLKKEADLELRIRDFENEKTASEEDIDEINRRVVILESMSAETAAPTLLAMKDRDDMLRVFKSLKSDTQSALLEAMAIEEAAGILEDMR